MTENEISYAIIGIAMELHKNIGAGLLESAYENALVYDLRENGFEVKQQLAMPFIYKEVKQDIGYRIDILVENKVLIEIKSVENLAPVHFSQTLTYLKLSGIKLGLLINFNNKLLKQIFASLKINIPDNIELESILEIINENNKFEKDFSANDYNQIVTIVQKVLKFSLKQWDNFPLNISEKIIPDPDCPEITVQEEHPKNGWFL